MNIKRSLLVSLVLVIALLCWPSASFAALHGRIVENVGVKTAKLGLHDSTNDHRIGKPWKRSRDNSYAGQVVWRYLFGTKSKSTGKYPVEMYSKGNHHVFTFIINTSRLVTKNGTHVGTTEAALTDRYGDRLTKSTTPTYTDYYMGTRNGRTDFWVRDGKVHHIVISRY